MARDVHEKSYSRGEEIAHAVTHGLGLLLAVTGLGWTLLPRTMLDDDLKVLRVKGLALTRTLGIATHARRTLSNAARAMIEACR